MVHVPLRPRDAETDVRICEQSTCWTIKPRPITWVDSEKASPERQGEVQRIGGEIPGCPGKTTMEGQ